MSSIKNAINWFEIPVKDFTRAKKFYETVMDSEITEMEFGGMTHGMFPCDMPQGGIGGAIVKGDGFIPSQTGSTVYLNAGDDLSAHLSKVEKAGGKITLPKTSIGVHGNIALFIDTEGNKIAFHSQN